MATSIFSGRSRHGKSSTRSSRAKPPTRRRPHESRDDIDEKVEVVSEHPNLEELRRKRSQYLAVSPDARRRISSSARTSKPKPDDPTSSLRTTPIHGDRRKRRRRHKSSTSSRDTKRAYVRSTDEDYVYTAEAKPAREASDTGQRSSPSKQSRRPPGSARRHTLPVVFESEVSPEDSISQVGTSNQQEHSRSVRSNRSATKRSTTPVSKVLSLGNSDDGQSKTAGASHQPAKRHSQPSLIGLLRRNTSPPTPSAPRLIECLTCAADDVPYAKHAKLACGHRMCHDCLKRVFELSIKDPAHMPPKCCTDDHIPLQHVDKLFDLKFKINWNRKYQEYHTKNRTYCPAPKCGEWIKPSHIHSSQGRKYAQCPRCQTKVCTLCNAKLHRSKECPKDPEIAKLVAQAKEKGWQSCFSCNAMVELKEGCNHMTCRCRAEFCMMCGAKWKTCECPWFNHSELPDPDRLMEWRVPEPINDLFQLAFGARPFQQGAPAPPHPRNMAEDHEARGAQTYAEELDQRRRQERLDADLARRLQLATLLDPDAPLEPRRQRRPEIWGMDNAVDHLLNDDDFVQNAADVVVTLFGETLTGRTRQRIPSRRRRPPRAVHQDYDSGVAQTPVDE